MSEPRRPRRWRIVGLVLVAVGILLGAGWLLVKWGVNGELVSRDLLVGVLWGVGPVVMGLFVFDGRIGRRRTRD